MAENTLQQTFSVRAVSVVGARAFLACLQNLFFLHVIKKSQKWLRIHYSKHLAFEQCL